MNNNFLDNDFREEELFQRFLEKQKSGVSIFDEEAYDAPAAEEAQPAETSDDEFVSAYKDYPVAEELADIMPLPLEDKESYTGTMGKIKYFFKYIADEENARRLSILVIPGFLILVFLINLLIPSSKISEKENRALAQFPEFSLSALADGSFTKGFEDYISDQFIARNGFVSSKRRIETLMGKKENHGILLADDGYLIENSADLSYENVDANLKAIEDLAKVGRYNISFAIVPTAYEIMSDKLPANSYTNVYDELISKVKNTVKSKNVKLADVKTTLKNNKDKDLYYRTDHHQTSHGSYYLYTALENNLGYKAYGRDRFKIEQKADDFFGTTWSNSGFAPSKADSVHRYSFDENYNCTAEFPSENKKMKSLYSDDKLKTKDKYAYFLDGNHGITEIKSSCPTGKRLAVIKDSYAHSLVPFLANHYSRIYMVDLRYYNGDIFEYLYNSDVKDVLVLYNQNTFMTDTNLSKISTFAKTSAYNSVPDVNYGTVPELEKVDISYFDDAVFVGDSLTMGIQYFSGFNSEFMCMAGMSTRSLQSDKLSNGKTVYESIASMEHLGKIYIMLGTNEAIYEKPQEFIKRYSDFIDHIRNYFPNAIVYIESIMPMSQNRELTADLKNYMITNHNKYLKELAKEKQCYYVDLNAYFAGEDGYLPPEAGGDGIHLSPDNYRKLADYLTTHAVDALGVKKIGSGKASGFKGGKLDTAKIGEAILGKVKFKDKLSKLSDALLLSNYSISTDDVLSASLYMGGGSTAEEIAVFELKSSKDTDKMVELVKKRIEKKKEDFRNYMPAEMPKLNNPTIVVKDNVVILVIADSADKDAIVKCIK